MKKILLLLCATLPLMAGTVATGHPLNGHGKVATTAGGGRGNPCSFLSAKTISRITGLHITSVRNLGDSCMYVDPKAPLNAEVEKFGYALSLAFSGQSPLRLKAAPAGGVPEPESGAGVIVRTPTGDNVATVNVHEYAESLLQEIRANPNPGVHCGALHDVSGLNAVSIVCDHGAIANGGVAKDGKAVHITYLAAGYGATNKVMGELVRAAAAHM